MPSLCHLPVELLTHVAQHLYSLSDLSALSCCGSRFVREVVDPILYARVKDEVGVLCWACDEGQLSVVERLLAAGADPRQKWIALERRMETLHSLFQRSVGSNEDVYPELIPFYREEMRNHDADLHEAWELDSLCGVEVESQGTSDYEEEAEDENEHNDIEPDIEYPGILDPGIHPPLIWDSDGETCQDALFWQPIHIAARWGHDDIVRLLLDHGVDVDATCRGFCDCLAAHPSTDDLLLSATMPAWTPLHIAICHGNESTAKLLLSRSASSIVSAEEKRDSKVTALHTACSSGDTSIARMLIAQHQLDIEAEDALGQTPVSYAYSTGMWECIDLLFEEGASLDARLGNWPIVKHACKENRFAEALRLIDLGADVNATFGERLAFDVPSPSGPPPALLCCCCRVFRDSYHPGAHGSTEMRLRALRQKHLRVDAVRRLLEMQTGARDDATNRAYSMLLAASCHLPQVLEIIVEAGGCDHWLYNRKGRFSALNNAVEVPNRSASGEMLNTVRLILRLLPKKLTQTEILHTLSAVCLDGGRDADRAKVVRLLLEYKQGINLQSKAAAKLWSPMVCGDNADIHQILFDYGLRVQPPTGDELLKLISEALDADSISGLKCLSTLDGGPAAIFTAGRLWRAMYRPSKRCLRYLINNGAPINERVRDYHTCLLWALNADEDEIATQLLARGADPNMYGRLSSDSPLIEAVGRPSPRLVRQLVRHGATVHSVDGYISPLRFAIGRSRPDCVQAMAESTSFAGATRAQIFTYLSTALIVPRESWLEGRSFTHLVRNNPYSLDTTLSNSEGVGFTALHLAIRNPQPGAIEELIRHGASIHHKAEPLPDDSGVPQEGLTATTPLESAITHLQESPETIRYLLELEPFEPWSDFARLHNLRNEQFDRLVDYIRAACIRQNSSIIKLLNELGLDFGMCDWETGDTAIHMVCDGLKWNVELHTNDNSLPWHTMVAARGVDSIVSLIRDLGLDPHTRNKNGVSGLDAIRRVMRYDGEEPHWKRIADAFETMVELENELFAARPGCHDTELVNGPET